MPSDAPTPVTGRSAKEPPLEYYVPFPLLWKLVVCPLVMCLRQTTTFDGVILQRLSSHLGPFSSCNDPPLFLFPVLFTSSSGHTPPTSPHVRVFRVTV